MGWSLIGANNPDTGKPYTLTEVVTTYNPMSTERATTQSNMSRLPPSLRAPTRAAATRAHFDREVRVVVAYLKMRQEADPKLFTSAAQCQEWIKTEFKKDLLARLRNVMRLPQPST